jgi:hypothetical protein
VKLEQSATRHPMSPVHNVPLEHPAHPVPQHAKPATKESLTTKWVVLVAIVYKKHFKIKTQTQVYRAFLVRQDGSNTSLVRQPASV